MVIHCQDDAWSKVPGGVSADLPLIRGRAISLYGQSFNSCALLAAPSNKQTLSMGMYCLVMILMIS